jgi:plastocyanin
MMTRIIVLVARATACLGRLPRSQLFLIAIIGLVALAEVAIAAQSFRISQKARAFNLKEIAIALGDTVLFGNDDDFIHQIYVKSDSFNIDTAESYPGNTLPVTFTKRGTFEVHCHIHPKMGLVVTVK